MRGELLDASDIEGGVRASAGDDDAVDVTAPFEYVNNRLSDSIVNPQR